MIESDKIACLGWRCGERVSLLAVKAYEIRKRLLIPASLEEVKLCWHVEICWMAFSKEDLVGVISRTAVGVHFVETLVPKSLILRSWERFWTKWPFPELFLSKKSETPVTKAILTSEPFRMVPQVKIAARAMAFPAISFDVENTKRLGLVWTGTKKYSSILETNVTPLLLPNFGRWI